MSLMMKKGLMLLVVVFCSVGVAFAGNRIGDQDKSQDQKRLSDESCLFDAADCHAADSLLVSQRNQGQGNGRGSGQQDRARDGSCLDNTDSVNGQAAMLISQGNRGQRKGKGGGQQDRLRDGSCLNYLG